MPSRLSTAVASAGLGPFMLLAACAGAPGVDLPLVGTVGDAPPAAATLAITVHRDGRLEHDRETITYAQFETRLRTEVAARPKQHLSASLDLSSLNLLLRVDREAPYGAVLPLLRRCTQRDACVNRVFYAVCSEDGDDGSGALALFLGADPGHATPLPSIWVLSATVRCDAATSDPAALYEAAAAALARVPPAAAKDAQFTVAAAGDVAFGFVLRCADAVLRAGFHAVFLGGGTTAPHDPAQNGLPVIHFEDRDLGSACAPMPQLARVHGAFAGVDDPMLVPEPPPPPVH